MFSNLYIPVSSSPSIYSQCITWFLNSGHHNYIQIVLSISVEHDFSYQSLKLTIIPYSSVKIDASMLQKSNLVICNLFLESSSKLNLINLL